MPCTLLIILQTAGCVMLLFADCWIFYGTTSVQLNLVSMHAVLLGSSISIWCSFIYCYADVFLGSISICDPISQESIHQLVFQSMRR
jgi:hypothetical protein